MADTAHPWAELGENRTGVWAAEAEIFVKFVLYNGSREG
jgi:hypothetical protein